MLLKKVFFLIALTILFSFEVYSAEAPTVSAECAAVIIADTGEIIYQKQPHKRHSMASTTKIMTGLLAIESGRLNETVTCRDISSQGSSVGLKKGDKLTLEALVYGLLLESGNDAAAQCAVFLSGSEENFARLMNKKAKELNMQSTNFVTSSGLDSTEHYSTAYDMALLGAYAVRNPVFRDFCSSKSKTVTFIEPDITVTFSNHNRLLSACDGVFGIKTGFTKKSGRCLVSACERNDVTLIAVTLNAGDDWNDHIKLYDYAFDEITRQKIYFHLPESIRVYSGKAEQIKIQAGKNQHIYAHMSRGKNLRQKIYLPDFIYAPVSSGEVIGRYELYDDDTLVLSENIIAKESVEAIEEKPDLFERIRRKIKDLFINRKETAFQPA